MLARYLHGPDAGADQPLVSYAGSSAALANARFLYPDRLGSIVLRADTAGGSAAIDTYDEYGVPGAGNQGRFQYTGQAWLPEVQLYYYKARMYWPAGGRFLQTDPVGYEDQFNLYAYVGDDPINRTDPSGKEAYCASQAGGGGASCTDSRLTWGDIGRRALDTLAVVSIFVPGAEEFGAERLGAEAVARTALRGSAEGATASETSAVAQAAQKLSKVERSKFTRNIGGKFTKKTDVRPGKGPGQSRAEYVRYKNSEGRTIRTYKDTYDRAGKFHGRDPLRGGPEGRPQDDAPSSARRQDDE